VSPQVLREQSADGVSSIALEVAGGAEVDDGVAALVHVLVELDLFLVVGFVLVLGIAFALQFEHHLIAPQNEIGLVENLSAKQS